MIHLVKMQKCQKESDFPETGQQLHKVHTEYVVSLPIIIFKIQIYEAAEAKTAIMDQAI